MAKNQLIWFRNNLRLHDNKPVHDAFSRASENGSQVVALFIFEPRIFESGQFGISRIGIHRRRFMRESLEELAQSLQELGVRLHFALGPAESVLERVVRDCDIACIHYQREIPPEELQVEAGIRTCLSGTATSFNPCPLATMIDISDLPFEIQHTPDVFSKFRRKVEQNLAVPEPLPVPPQIPGEGNDDRYAWSIKLNEVSYFAENSIRDGVNSPESRQFFQGGETAGLQRLNEYFWALDCLKEYKLTRNGMLGQNYSSKFSAWLALGCISPRYIYQQVKQYEHERIANDSTYWLIFELLWRDYFVLTVAKYGSRVFQVEGLRQLSFPWATNQEQFQAWCEGRTGFPLIDANMRELACTGFMSNRGRQNVASFLTKNLGIDWRLGAAWFESLLLDYDPCSNYGNWNYVAGVGNDPRGFRWFNTLKQASNYDPEGDYVKHWLPELDAIPIEFIHKPWELTAVQQANYGCRIGDDYPAPIVDLFASANANQRKYDAVN